MTSSLCDHTPFLLHRKGVYKSFLRNCDHDSCHRFEPVSLLHLNGIRLFKMVKFRE